MSNTPEIIASAPLFGGLPLSQREDVGRIAVERRYRKGDVIFSEGDPGSGFFIVAVGKVKIYKVSPDGKEHILHIFGPGEPFGEVPVFTAQPFPANAQALSKARLLFFPRSAFVDLIAANPSLALNMLAVLSLRLREFTLQIENLSLKEVPARLASYLIYLAQEQGNDTWVVLNISKGQLASLLGTIPETLSRIFAKLTVQRLIEVSGRDIRLLNRAGLVQLAEFGKFTA
ncbi:MAG: Crp/Fnr family transcriptional regulator [Desulfobacterales bacterium]|nr:Crp/Fnr family transcriptional regulator [Desulfobacterales bacterium]